MSSLLALLGWAIRRFDALRVPTIDLTGDRFEDRAPGSLLIHFVFFRTTASAR